MTMPARPAAERPWRGATLATPPSSRSAASSTRRRRRSCRSRASRSSSTTPGPASRTRRCCPRLIDLLRDVWRVARVAVDATGLGETTARAARRRRSARRASSRVKFTAASEVASSASSCSRRSTAAASRCTAATARPSTREFRRQAELARVAYRANRTMNFFVDERDGHDDYLDERRAARARVARPQPRRVAIGTRCGSRDGDRVTGTRLGRDKRGAWIGGEHDCNVRAEL